MSAAQERDRLNTTVGWCITSGVAFAIFVTVVTHSLAVFFIAVAFAIYGMIIGSLAARAAAYPTKDD